MRNITKPTNCTHWWILGNPLDGLTTGRCKKCGILKTFDETNKPEFTNKPEPKLLPISATKVLSNGKIKYKYGKPAYTRDKPYKRGHYKKVATKIEDIMALHIKHISNRKISKRLVISKNVVGYIIKEIENEQPR